MPGILTAARLSVTFDAFNRHDIDGVMAHFAADCVFYTVAGNRKYGDRIESAAAIAKALPAVWQTMPDAHWDPHGHFVHGDRAVSERTFCGTDPAGMRIEAEGADLFTKRDE